MKAGLQISQNWCCRYTYKELKERTEFVFKFNGLWDNRPILKLREPIDGMDLIQVDYDYLGIINGSEAIYNDKWQPYKPTMI